MRLSKARTRCGGAAFTLVELLVVVLILAILMAVALPLYLNAVADASRKTCRANMQTIASAVQAQRTRTRATTFTTNLADLAGDLQATPKCPDGGTYTITANAGSGSTLPSFTVNCSVTAHNAGANGEPNGYSPGVNSQ